MKIKIKQLFDEITKQKVYPLTTLKAVRDPKSKKALDEMLLIGEESVEAEEVAQRDADILGGKYRASDIDKSMTYDEDESTEVVEDVVIVDADRLGGKYTATDVDALKQRIVELEAENEKLNNSLKNKQHIFIQNKYTSDNVGRVMLNDVPSEAVGINVNILTSNASSMNPMKYSANNKWFVTIFEDSQNAGNLLNTECLLAIDYWI